MTAWNPSVMLLIALMTLVILFALLYRQAYKDRSAMAVAIVIVIISVIIGVLIEYVFMRTGEIGGIIASQPLKEKTVDPVAAGALAVFFALVIGLISGFLTRLVAEGFSLQRFELIPIGMPLGSAVGYIITPSLSGVILCGIAAGLAWMAIWLVSFGINEPDETEGQL